MFGYFAVGCVALSLAVLAHAGRLWSPALLLYASMLPMLAGLAAATPRAEAAWVVPAFMVIFALGISAGSRQSRGRGNGEKATLDVRPSIWTWSVVVVVFLAAVHFLTVGIVSLSGDVETARFDLDSGFAGIPGRAAVVALPILALVIALQEQVSRALVAIVWSAFILSRVALGFKSGLLEVVIIGITVLMCKRRKLSFNSVVLLAVAAAGAIVYANWVGGRYGSISGDVFSSSYLADRLGRQSAQAVNGALHLGAGDNPSSFVTNDVRYFFAKYAGRELPAGLFPVDQMVSAHITGTPLSRGYFLVPVTIGGPAYLLGSIPVLPIGGTMVAAFFLGKLWEAVYLELSTASPSGLPLLVSATLLIGLRTFVLSGGGAYLVINYFACFLMIAIPLIAWRTIGDPARRRVQTQR